MRAIHWSASVASYPHSRQKGEEGPGHDVDDDADWLQDQPPAARTRKKEVKNGTRQPAVGWGRRRVGGHAHEVPPDADTFHLGAEPFTAPQVSFFVPGTGSICSCVLVLSRTNSQMPLFLPDHYATCQREPPIRLLNFGIGKVSWPECAAPRRQDLQG